MNVAPPAGLVFGPSPIHGTGCFAARPFAAGERILEYRGERIGKTESNLRMERGNVFIFTLNDEWDIDGSVEWNDARLVNHSCRPNAEAAVEEERIWIVALRPIAPGEEITFNYNFDLEDYHEYPCRCGAPDCVGYIVAEELFDHVRSADLRRRRKRCSGAGVRA